MGLFVAWVAFRWYHLPIMRGAGWSWGPRSKDRAWGVGLGVQGYAARDDTRWKTRNQDLELGEQRHVPEPAGAIRGDSRAV